MNTDIRHPAAPRGTITWLMVLCGMVGAMAAGAAGAATPQESVPSIAVHYTAEQLATADGAREFYHTLVKAAEQVCPNTEVGSRLPGSATLQCRRQALSQAVQQVHSERLAELYTSRTKRG
jgi:UrcA family protein